MLWKRGYAKWREVPLCRIEIIIRLKEKVFLFSVGSFVINGRGSPLGDGHFRAGWEKIFLFSILRFLHDE